VGALRDILAGQDEGGAGGGSDQRQCLTEPVQAHLALAGLEAEGAALGREEQDAFGHAQAVLGKREQQQMNIME